MISSKRKSSLIANWLALPEPCLVSYTLCKCHSQSVVTSPKPKGHCMQLDHDHFGRNRIHALENMENLKSKIILIEVLIRRMKSKADIFGYQAGMYPSWRKDLLGYKLKLCWYSSITA